MATSSIFHRGRLWANLLHGLSTHGRSANVVSIGYPGPVLRGRPVSEPYSLGRGWVGFDFGEAFGFPVKVVNDAADVVSRLIAALEPDDTVLGGGNVKKLEVLPPHCRAGDNV
jgi:hypothetical protein